MVESLVIQLDYLGFIMYKGMPAMYRERENNAGEDVVFSLSKLVL